MVNLLMLLNVNVGKISSNAVPVRKLKDGADNDVSASPSNEEAEAAAKGTKGGPGRNLVNFFNLSPRRPRDLTKRRSSFIRRRSIEEEAEAAAAHEAALRHLQQLPQQPHPEEVDEADEGEEWTQGLKKPRRKRSISIPLSSYRLELEFMSLKSALSKGDSGGGNGESGGGGKTARRLRRKGAAEGSSKKTRKGHSKFNTITNMTDTRQYYFMDEFEECGAKKAER